MKPESVVVSDPEIRGDALLSRNSRAGRFADRLPT